MSMKENIPKKETEEEKSERRRQEYDLFVSSGHFDRIPMKKIEIGEIVVIRHGRDTFVGRRHEVVALMQESEKLIEAMPKGVKIRGSTLMPFADQPGRVSCVLQGFGNRDFRICRRLTPDPGGCATDSGTRSGIQWTDR